MRRLIAAALVGVFLALVAALSLSVPGDAGAQSTEDVELGNLYFCDPSYQDGICVTTITAGDTVTWDNTAGLHTVTQCNADFSVCPLEGGFDSGFMNAGTSFSYTFNSAGAYSYWCSLHPIEMRGEVIVQDVTPTPSPTAEPTPTPAGQTASPTAAPSVTPAVVPSTGGPLGSTESSLPTDVLLAGILAAILGAAALLRLTFSR